MRRAAMEELRVADVILHLHPAPEGPAPPFVEVARLDQPPRGPVVTVYTKGDVVTPERAGGAGGQRPRGVGLGAVRAR